MLAIADHCREDKSQRMLVMAPRNVHKAFINACILLDIDVEWVYPAEKSRSLCSSGVTAHDIWAALRRCPRKIDAVYITSPDYLGFIADIPAIAEVCKSYNVPLIVVIQHTKPCRATQAVRCCIFHKTPQRILLNVPN